MRFKPTKPEETRELKAVLHNGLLYVDDGEDNIFYTNNQGIQKASVYYSKLSQVSCMPGAQSFYAGDTLEVTF